MKEKFEWMKIIAEDSYPHQYEDEVLELVKEIINTDPSLLTIGKKWTGYGTWKSAAFVNEYHFGDELAQLIKKALSGRITHDEDFDFDLDQFQNELFEVIFEGI